MNKIKLDSTEHNIFFTSDLHLAHRNIITFCNRPWHSTEEMDAGLIKNWNTLVGDDDIVFDLGDFAFASSGRWKSYLASLRGHHHLIRGNHDISRDPGPYILSLFDSVSDQLLLNIDGRQVYLNHYPFLCYAGTYKNPKDAVWQLFGHVHSSPTATGKDDDRLTHLFPYQYDVGVDNNNYFPVPWSKICEIIDNQVSKSLK